MHWLFAALRFYPYWALPGAMVAFELGMFMRRRMSRFEWACWATVGFFALTTILWFVFRGDVHSDRWLKVLLKG